MGLALQVPTQYVSSACLPEAEAAPAQSSKINIALFI
jgi:hypothetical protein